MKRINAPLVVTAVSGTKTAPAVRLFALPRDRFLLGTKPGLLASVMNAVRRTESPVLRVARPLPSYPRTHIALSAALQSASRTIPGALRHPTSKKRIHSNEHSHQH